MVSALGTSSTYRLYLFFYFQITQWATQAFFRYGGEPVQTSTQPAASGATVDLLQTRTDPMASYIVGSPIQGGSSQGSFLATPVPMG